MFLRPYPSPWKASVDHIGTTGSFPRTNLRAIILTSHSKWSIFTEGGSAGRIRNAQPVAETEHEPSTDRPAAFFSETKLFGGGEGFSVTGG